METASEGVLVRSRHQVVVLDFEFTGEVRPVAVKYFARQSAWKDRYDQKRGSKAARSFEAATFLQEHEVATPPPIAYFDRWEGNRLVESFYLSEYLGELKSFKTELIRLYESNGPCEALVGLLEHVGDALRKMHDAGFYHRDLGNQNIELLKSDDDRTEVHFLDLNRGRVRDELSLRERAQDFSRLKLPSAFLEIFFRIYWHSKVPADFRKEVARQRRRFFWWQKSRRLRHPIKSYRKSRRNKSKKSLRLEDVWIWDNRSAQASITLDKADRRKRHSWLNNCKVAYSTLKAAWAVRRQYRLNMKEAFTDRVSLSGRIGMSLEPTDLDFDQQLPFLEDLGKVPVLLRFGHHEGKDQWDRSIGYLDSLHKKGYPLIVAVLQDRRSVLEPDSWKNFLDYLFENIAGKVEKVEIGHVINRVKWGIHDLREYKQLMAPVVALREAYSEIEIVGPACIDFEMHHTVAALENLPAGLRFGALSHHLYVDRRGAPENKQGAFGTVEKVALLKAISENSHHCDGRVLVSEVNWPLVNTGSWSPVAASYLPKGAKGSRVHVSEEQYGHYMIRYLALVLCSGFVEQVYWWRLVAHGFGLIDERDSSGWRERVGFRMLKAFLQQLGQATFVEKLDTPENVYALRFERGAEQVVLLWCNGCEFSGPWPLDFDQALDAQGGAIELRRVGEEPVYLVQSRG